MITKMTISYAITEKLHTIFGKEATANGYHFQGNWPSNGISNNYRRSTTNGEYSVSYKTNSVKVGTVFSLKDCFAVIESLLTIAPPDWVVHIVFDAAWGITVDIMPHAGNYTDVCTQEEAFKIIPKLHEEALAHITGPANEYWSQRGTPISY